MKRSFLLFLGAMLVLLVPAAQAKGVKADVYAGYSHVGANLYAPYTSGMNGWQIAGHVRPIPFVGIEGDLSHYAGTGSESVTLFMAGPRATVGTAGFSVFAHGLVGPAYYSDHAVSYLPGVSYTSVSYALGGGADIAVLLGLKLRVTGDYLGNNKAPVQGSPSPYRIGVGLAYHF